MSHHAISPIESPHVGAFVLACMVAGGMLAFDPGGWHTFGPVKWTVITVAAWLSLGLMVRRQLSLHRTSLLGWAAFLLWAAIASLLALDPPSAWLGTPDRRLGMVALLTMGVAFLAGQGVVDGGGRRLLGRAAVVALTGMAGYGLAEAVGWRPVELTTTSPRLGSTLGSAAYLGAALCLLAPMSVGLLTDPRETKAWRVMGGLAVGGAGFLLAGSATRAALVGLGAAAAVTAPVWWRPVRRRAMLVGVLAVVLAGTLVAAPGARRLVQPEVEGRVAEWRTAASVLVSRPLTGTGLEGYRVAFPEHVDVEYVQLYGRTTVTDRAHSGPLDMGVAVGVIGVAAWMAAAGWLTIRAWHASRLGDPLITGMAAGVVALFAQELFLFPTLEVGVAGWAVAGMVVTAHPDDRRVRIDSPRVAWLVLAVACFALLAGVADVTADHLAASARRSGDVTGADRAAALRPDSFRYRLLAADVALRANAPAEALGRIDAALDLSPVDPALRLARARVVAALVAEGRWEPDRAAEAVARSVTKDPNHPELRLIHGDLLVQAGSGGEAERAWLAAGHLSPREAAADLRLTSLYLSLGKEELARAALGRARARQPDHPEIARLDAALEDV